MKKQRNDFQLKDQQNFPEGTSNEADLFRLIDTELKKEEMKILTELRKAIKCKLLEKGEKGRAKRN